MKKDHTTSTRTNRFEKRNRTKKLMAALGAAAVILVLVYIGLFTFTGGTGPESENTATESANEEENKENDSNQESEDNNNDNSQELEVKENEEEKDSEEDSNEEDSSEEEENSNDEEESSEEDRQVEESSDENVDRVITEDWEPIGTEQDTSGDHTTTYQQGSQDWEEVIKAARVATGLNSEEIIEWRVENAGDGQVHAVISNQSQDPVYRVLIEWVDGEGYRPIQVEELNGNPYN
ncbi:YrrS family protein [Halobacillus sp. Marseille-P3879]|uniref:YrrS family protein n=1 Tax=Halobacillus sp. Marseille-P3879 TaxID=2045014 RepID=UPI00135C76AE|nr:YrrS family protein [Halobacillus sp. Marseille-P3879]